jgi:hypothetical protein
MKDIRSSIYARPLALYLIFALIALAAAAGPAEAMLVPALPDARSEAAAAPSSGRGADLASVQKVLESKVLQQRLMDYGLTPEETTARINALSDEQLHQMAANMDALQPGGDVLGTLFALALIGALVVLIIFILQGRIAIERK